MEAALGKLAGVSRSMRDQKHGMAATWLEKLYTMESERAVMKNTLLAVNGK
jgi:hypothetical protein